jgi:hypothetical protein
MPYRAAAGSEGPAMAKAPAELGVIVRMYDLVLWTCKHLAGFPRSFRCTLGDRMEARLYQVLDTLLRAKYDRGRREALLREANMELELLRFHYRMAKDLKCLSVDSYGHAARTVNEVGQMVGGWLRNLAGGPREAPA